MCLRTHAGACARITSRRMTSRQRIQKGYLKKLIKKRAMNVKMTHTAKEVKEDHGAHRKTSDKERF